MNSPTRAEYLLNEVKTAAPQKLQLMLVEAAIRNCQRVKTQWSEGRDQAAGEAIVRAQEIVAQILGGLSSDRSQPLVRQVAAVYAFISRTLAKAHLERDGRSLDEVLRVLEIERETWQQLCRQLGPGSDSVSAPFHGRAPAAPHFGRADAAIDCDTRTGFCMDA